jgi:hypothetical protein
MTTINIILEILKFVLLICTITYGFTLISAPSTISVIFGLGIIILSVGIILGSLINLYKRIK